MGCSYKVLLGRFTPSYDMEAPPIIKLLRARCKRTARPSHITYYITVELEAFDYKDVHA